MKYHNNNLTDVENVGEQLCRIRKEKGLTQKQAAEVTYHTRDWLSNVEIGRTPITFVDAVRQLEAYDRLDEVDHLVQSICTSAGTRQGSTVVGTIKIEYYRQLLIYYLIYRFNF
jgi:transcriptional regulator with XRE-family HTH domain